MQTVSSTRLSTAFGRFRITAPPIWLAVLLPLAFFTFAALSFAAFGTNTPVWVSNAFVVTALLRNQRSTWPVLLFLAAVADYAAQVYSGAPIVGLAFCAFDSFEILLVATLSGFAGTTVPALQIWPLARLALVSVLVPIMSAAAGGSLATLAFGGSFLRNWKPWYLASVCGLLTVTPLLLSWTDRAHWADRSRRVNAQIVVLAGLVAVVGYFDFHDAEPGMFLAFPFLLLTAFSGGLAGATTAAADAVGGRDLEHLHRPWADRHACPC